MEIKDKTRNLKIFCKWKFISAVKRYETVYEFKKAHLKTRYWGLSILLDEEILGKIFMKQKYYLYSCYWYWTDEMDFKVEGQWYTDSFIPFVSLFSFCYTKKAWWLVITGAFQSDTKTRTNPGDLWILNILNKIDKME